MEGATTGELFLTACMSTRMTYDFPLVLAFARRKRSSNLLTSKGWFQQLKAPPIVEAAIFSPMVSWSVLFFPLSLRIGPSAAFDMPMRLLHPVICRRATALTPLLTPRIPCVRRMLKKVSIVPGTRVPLAISLFLVTSTVFMHVVMPMVRYDWAAPPATPPSVAATAGASARLFDAKYATSEDVNIKIAPFVVASMTAYFPSAH